MTITFPDKACAVTVHVHGKHIYCWSDIAGTKKMNERHLLWISPVLGSSAVYRAKRSHNRGIVSHFALKADCLKLHLTSLIKVEFQSCVFQLSRNFNPVPLHMFVHWTADVKNTSIPLSQIKKKCTLLNTIFACQTTLNTAKFLQFGIKNVSLATALKLVFASKVSKILHQLCKFFILHSYFHYCFSFQGCYQALKK